MEQIKMMKHHLWTPGSITSSFGNHIDPGNEEHLKNMKLGNNIQSQNHLMNSYNYFPRIWDAYLKPKTMQLKSCIPAQWYPERGYLWYIEFQIIRKIETKVERILKLSKTINHGNKVDNLNKKSELIHLTEDFHQQYESLYTLYEDLRQEVKKNVNEGDNDNRSSTSSSDSEAYYSPQIGSDTSDHVDDTMLKDKLTSSSEVQKTMIFDNSQSNFISKSQDSMDILKHDSENERLKLEISSLCKEKGDLEEKISRLEVKVLEIEAGSKEEGLKNTELSSKIMNHQKILHEQDTIISHLRNENEQAAIRLSDSKSSFKLLEQKTEEIAQEFTKQFEDKCRILNKRIAVAEQLHRETKQNVKGISIKSNDLLTKLDVLALNIEQKTDKFSNRISEAASELRQAKHLATTNNKALLDMKDNKEAEILAFTEKVRAYEETMKEKEEEMVGLKEEKKEAIRQLCVGIDYHRSRADEYKKMLFESNAGLRRAS